MRYIKVLLPLVAGSILLAPNANADEDSYRDALRRDGFPVTTTAVSLGHTICGSIATDGTKGVVDMITIGLRVGMSPHNIATLVYDAVTELCPSQLPTLLQWSESYGRDQDSHRTNT